MVFVDLGEVIWDSVGRGKSCQQRHSCKELHIEEWIKWANDYIKEEDRIAVMVDIWGNRRTS